MKISCEMVDIFKKALEQWQLCLEQITKITNK